MVSYALGPLSVWHVCNVHVLWPNSRTDEDETWHGGRPQPRPHCVREGSNSSPLPKKGHSNQFLAHVCCGQTARWIKMPSGMQVGLSPGNIVLDGDPAPPWKGAQQPPTFQTMSIVANRPHISATAELLSVTIPRSRRQH